DNKGCTTTVSKTITEPATLTASATSVNVSCNGSANGSIDLTPGGGTTPYTYSWSNGATTQDLTGLAAGTYSVTVTDSKGCTATTSKTITQPATLTASATGTNVNCNGGTNGTVTLAVGGGTTPYTYSWSNGATTQNLTGLSAGTYSVTVTDANGCTATASKTITQPTTLTATTASTNSLCYGCNNGTASVTPAGGTSPYTYLWSTGATTASVTGLTAGTYTVTVTDNKGCTVVKTVTITQPAVFTASAAGTNVNCYGGSNGTATLTVSGGTTPYTYGWSNGATTQNLSGLSAGTYSVVVTDANSYTTTATVTITQPAVLAATATQTNVSCNGGSNGSIDVTVTGGTTPYTYLWNGGATTQDRTGLSAGTYSVLVTDNKGCTTTVSKTITEPATLTASATSTNVSCNGGSNGSIDLTPGGGTTPYTYSWSNGATTQDLSGLSAGTYSVTVTDSKGCTATASKTISQPATLTASAAGTNVNCNGGTNGTVTLTVGGGTTPYTYSWNNGATTQNLTGLSAGTYSVTVTDANGCTATASKTITQPTTLTATTASTNALCYGCNNGTASVTPAGGTSPYTYLWSTGATTASVTGLTAGTYTVTVTDNKGCTVVKTVTITQPAVFTASAAGTNVNCYGGSNGTATLTVSGGTTPYTYSWSNGATTQNLSGLSAGTYSVVVTDANSYTTTATVTITQPAVLAATATQENVRCYGESNGSIDLSVTGGTTAYTYSWSTGATTQDITGLSAGTYSVLVTDAHGCTATVTKTITQPALLTATTSSTNALCYGCNNGTASVTPAGGTSPYTYLWSNGGTTASVTGLVAGTYTVTVTDANGCTVVKTVTITQPEELTITITHTNVSCHDGTNGTADITVAGGTTPYSYTWSNGAHTEDLSGLSAGTYSVVVTDAHGYTVTASATVTEPATLTATATQENVRCYGESNGSVHLSVTGGTTAYTYSWSTGATTQDITGLSAGTYSVLVTDAHGCTATVTKTITQPTLLTATTSSTNALCYGCNNGTADVTPAGGTSPYTYLWSNGATTASVTGLVAGTYTVTVTDANGCTVVKTVTITQPEDFTIAITHTNVSCHDGTNGTADITVAGGTTPYTYTWSNGATTEDLSGLSAGTYSVVVTDAHGYTVTASATVTEPATLVAIATQENVRCYGESNGSIDLSVTGGITAYTYSWSTGATTQDITGLAAGTYSVLVTDAHGCTATVSKTITQPTLLTATTSSTNALCYGCNNGTASVTPAGGTSPYTYLWSNGATTASVTGLTAGTYTVTVTDAHGCTVVKTVTITQPEELTITITHTNVSCHDGTNGTADITVAGGTTPYTYSWSNGATTEDLAGLSAGTYSVVVTDAHGYTVTASATVAEPATLVATATQENVRCYGESNGSVDLSVTGGTTAYTYSWSTGATTQDITGLSAGTYSVLVTDAHGCTATVTKTITQPTLLTATTSSTNALCYGCNNGTASVTPAGGTSPYTYLWSNGGTTASVTGLVAGTYTVTVTDANGCTVVKTVTITQPEDFTITITHTNVSCHDGTNGTADITVAGGTTPYTYSWSNGATTEDLSGLSAGTYSVVVTDAHGYTVTASATVTEPATLVATATQENVRCYGESNGSVDLSVTGGTTAYTYSWSNGATTQDITGLAAGTYSVLVTDAHGCTATVTKTITQPTLLTATTSSTNALCYGCNNGTASVTPAGGTSPYTYLWSNGATTASVTGLIAGTYTVTVTDANGCTVVKTVTITQPEELTITITHTNVSCHDGTNGTADITVAGGTTPYTYSWSNGATTEDLADLSAGTYSVVVADAHGYTVTASATVTEPTPLALTGTTNHVVCGCLHGMGEIYTEVTGGTAPYTYMWSDGATTSFDTGLWTGTYTVVVTDANGCTVTDAYSVVSPWQLEAATTVNNVSCNGGSNGSISLAVTGGIAPYTYSWSTGATTSSISDLVSGVYSVTVTDANGCSRPEIFVVEEPATFEVTGVATDAACAGVNNGTIDVTASGGTAPYTYNWSNGTITEDVTGLAAGTYTVTVTDAHSCTTGASFTISAPAAMTITGTTNTVVCGCMHGMGEIYTEVTGGTAPYTYLWSNGATTSFDTGLWTGTYSVTVTDANGCTANGAYSVISPLALVADGAIVNVSCPGGTDGAIAMTVSGGIAPYTFNWSTGSTASSISGLTAGVYSVAVTDANGCAKPYIFVVEEPATTSASGTVADVTCYGGSNGAIDITVSGGTAPFTYSWSTGATTQDISGLAAGTYSLTITDAHGCSSAFTYTVTEDPLTAVTISGPSVVCVGSAIPFTGTPAGGTWASSTPAKATVTSTGIVYGITIGTTNITYTSPAGCRSIMAVTVNGAVPAITGPTNVCANQSITLSNTMTGGIWTSANTALAVVDSFSGVVTGVFGSTVNITYSASAGCYRTTNIWVKALPQPITGSDTLCAGFYVQLYSSMGTTGTWSSSDPSVASVGLTTGFLTAVSTGTTTITYRLTASGCYVTRTQTTRLSPAPVTGPSNICNGTSTTLSSSPAGGTWMSSNNSVATVGTSSGVVNAVANGGTTIRYTLPNGCYANRPMTVNPLPGIITGTLGICVGSSTTLSTSSSGCSWSSSNTSVATITSTGVVTGVGMGTATITVSNGFGCIRTAVVTVNVLGTNSGDAVVCIGQTTTLTNPTAGGTWSTSNSARATVNSSTGVVTGISLGTVNISYRVGTCYSITTVTVNSNAYSIGGTASVCAGLSTTLTYPVSGGTWSSSNTARATVGETTGIVTGVSAGTATITYSITSSCFRTVVVTVETLSAEITGSASVCSGATTTLSIATTGGAWSSGNASVATINATSGAVTGIAPGTATITYTGASGCYTTRVITVFAAPAEVTGTAFVCAGSTTILANATEGGSWSSSNSSVATVSASGIVTGVSAGTANIVYTLGAGCSSSVVVTVGAMPGEITGAASVCGGTTIVLSSSTGGGTWTSSNAAVASVSSTGVVTGGVAGTATVTYMLSSGCYRTRVITVIPMPSVAPITGEASAMCPGTSIALSNGTAGGSWSSSNTAVATVSGSGLVTGVAPGTAVISYSVTGDCGTTSVTRTVTVNGTPDPGTISGPNTMCVGSTVALHASVAGGLWIAGNPEIATTCPCNSGHVTGIAPGVAIMSYKVTNDCGVAYATYPVTVNAVPSVAPGLVTPVIAGATSAALPFTTTASPTMYSIAWGTTAASAGFTDVTSATLTGSPLAVTVPSSAAENTYLGMITVSTAYCTSAAQPFSITVNNSVNIYTYAGIGTNGYTGNGNAATLAKMSHPYNIATDCDGNTFIADFENAVIRKVSPTGVITTVAGNGTIGYSGDGGPATNARMSNPTGITMDAGGNVYFSDFNNHVVRRISTSGIISRVAGNLANGYSGDGGAATSAKLKYPSGLAFDGAGNLYIADNGNHVIRKVTPTGIITTCAGTNIPGYTGDSAAATAARLNNPKNVHVDNVGNLYISDWGNQVVRKVDAGGMITTLAGNGITGYSGDGGAATAAKLDHPYGITSDAAGNVYFSEYTNQVVRKVNPAGIISTIAGMHLIGYSGDGGPALLARLYQPMGLSRDCAGRIFIADNANYVVRILGEYNRVPYFPAGAVQNVDVCYGSGPISLNTRLAVTDYDTLQPLTWTVVTAPAHGTLVAGYSATTTGATITPSGLSYTPASGYTGADVFVVKANDGIASAFTTINVTVSTAPVAGVISGTSAICGSGTTHLITTGTGGSWSSSNTSVAIVDAYGYVSGVGYGTSTISYTVTNACGNSYATRVVTFNPMPYAGSIIGAAKVCRGSSIPYISPVTGGYWSSGNTSIATVSSTGVVYGVDTGLTTISYTVSNVCGTAYGLRDVTVEILPTTSPITGPGSICAGASTTLYDATPHGAWYTSDTSIATIDIDNGTITGVSAGTVLVSYRHNTSCGIVMVTTVFTVNPVTTTIPAIGGTGIVCPGSSVTLTNSMTGGTWSTTDYPVKFTVNSTTGVVTGVAAGTGVVTYTVAHDCGVSYVTRVLTVNPIATVAPITGTSSICVGWTITASDATAGGVWSSSNPSLATVNSAGVITGIAGGNPVISYSVTNYCGTVVATRLVPVGVPPAVSDITGPSVVCVGSTVTLGNSTTGGSWTTSDITHAAVSSAGIVTGVGEGTATISYSVHNGCGYSSTSKVLTVNPLPTVATITGPSTVCVGTSISLANASTGGVWSSSSTGVATVSGTGVVSGISYGTSTISYAVTNSCGTVVATKDVSVLVLAATATVSHVTTPGGTDGCILLSVVGGTMPYTFLWSNGATTQNLTGLTAGTYSVVVTDAVGETVTLTVTVNEVSARGVAAATEAGVMYGAHPNPFVSQTTIHFNLPVGKFATVDVFNAATGIKVATIYNDVINPGEEYTATLNGENLAAGVYIYRVSTEYGSYIGKVLLLK
ncbi:MAG: Ig-like domain-containing protein, partial [Taibaiella sp.]|nr:Ig-like domain-containing protein [Taibaiella sp.]